PLHTLHRARRRLLTVACAPRGAAAQPSVSAGQWSAPFSIDDVGRVYVRMPVSRADALASDSGRNEVLIKIDIILEGACLFVILQREDKCWPYLIENLTHTDIVVWQHQEKHADAQASTTPASLSGERKYLVKAGESLDYAWDVPTAQSKLLMVSAQGSVRKVSLQEIGEQRPFVYGRPPMPPAAPARRNPMAVTLANQRAIAEYTMNIEVVASGPRQVLRLTGYAPEHSLYAPPTAVPRLGRAPTAQSTATQRTSRSSDERFEVVEDERTRFVFRLGLEGGVGISVINRYASEILFATLADMELKYTDSTSNQTFRLTVKWVQIDNQIYGALFPIVLYPTTLGAVTAGVSSPPALQAVVVRAKDRSYGVEYFKYASVLVQEVSVELDEDFLYALLDFVKFDVPGRDARARDAGESDDDDDNASLMLASAIPEVRALDEGLQLYFEFLHIQPFKLNISFMRTQRLDVGGDPTAARYPAVALGAHRDGGDVASYSPEHGLAAASEHTGEGVASTPGVVAYAMNVLTMAIGNINEAPVSLNALIMQNVRVSLPVLADRMQKHYSQEV
ncbi:Vacuolar protein sorting-associated protein 13, partial [Coemansia sp. RSA 2708]